MSSPPVIPLADLFFRSVRFWEFRRLFYNLVLIAVVVLWVAVSWPHFRPAFNLAAFLLLAVLAVFANLCYSFVYFLELLVLRTDLQTYWFRWCPAVWIAGTLFAVLLENYWIADEIYPYVH